MIVLDYLKKTVDNCIQIPPFHTGHLGLVPETEVSVGLMTFPGTGDQHCELLITPYEPSTEDMAYVHCIMRDRPGVVQLLIEAVSLLGINIITQESSAINSLNHHAINLIIDWSSSIFANLAESDPSQRSRYSEWQALFPFRDGRYVRLFESIIAHCGHLLIWEESARSYMPRLLIRPLNVQNVRPRHPVIVERDTSRMFQVKIKLPVHILAPLHNRLNTTFGEPLDYALLSDTDDRTLRVFFPNPALITRTVHLAFYHRDLPGALSAITHLLAKENFNILTSLLRKISPQFSVWEAILEYRGTGALPLNTEEQRNWVAERLRVRTQQEHVRVARYQIELGLPLYPKPKEELRIRVPLLQSREVDESAASPVEIDRVLHDRINEARAALGVGTGHINRMLTAVASSIGKTKRSIFLSFPGTAEGHADLLRNALEPHYEMRIYQAHGAEVITDAVLDMIGRSDYFVGIWHHDEKLPTSDRKYGISPWMPFEYGIASSLHKPCLVVHSDRLDERIWKRINPGIGNPEYTDLMFAKDAVNHILDHCKKNFP